MGGTDGIAAHVLEQIQAAYPGVVVPDRTKGAGIVVQADALQEGLFSVQEETVRTELNRPDAESRFIDGLRAIGTLDRRPGQI